MGAHLGLLQKFINALSPLLLKMDCTSSAVLDDACFGFPLVACFLPPQTFQPLKPHYSRAHMYVRTL